MAQVATVYSIAPFPRGPADILHSLRDADDVDARRPRPTDKRVWASVEKSAATVIREAFAEALRRDHGSSFTAQVAAANGGVMQRLHSFNAKKQFSSGIIEGLNNKAKVTLRKAYGYRTFRIAELSPYHVLGRLPEPKLAHRFV
ncbi:MAG: transposase [Betaproteobacteria bacterium]